MERIADRAIWKLAVSVALIGGTLVFLGRGAVTEVEPYKMVDELVTTDLSRWAGRELKVHGWVLAGSIVDVWQHQPTTSFVLQKGGKQIRVIATTPSTWLLRPQMELVVEGRLVPASSVSIVDAECAAHDGAAPSEHCRVQLDEQDYVLVASALNGKCPCKYDGAYRNECPPPPPPPSDRFR
jgi:hypothetical protein